ncbi:MAG: hypothetical protein H7Z41_13790 [Cytophagales bacterium]|nr:hypothetical protein [Armatimonadota bacterium]
MSRNHLILVGLLGAFAATVTVAAATAPSPAPPLLRGIPQKEDPDMIAEWGVGDSFMAYFATNEARASSALPGSGTAYGAKNAFDGKVPTAWIEGADGDGVGQWVEYTLRDRSELSQNPSVNALAIFNGYRKSRDLWRKNGRVRRLRMSVNGKPWGEIALVDSFAYQKVNVKPFPIPSKRRSVVVRFTIASVYRGTTYRDTALSEIEFYGTGVL